MADVKFTTLRTSRLVLRRLRIADLVEFCAYRSLPEVARYQSWETFDGDDGELFIAEQSELHPDLPGTWFQMAIVLDDGGAIAGDCGLHTRGDDPQQVEVGITLAPAHQRQGYATEALSCLLEYVFSTLQKRRVTAVVDAENRPAADLFRRLKFRQEGHFLENVWFKGKWGDEFSFGLLRREWMARSGLVSGDEHD